MLIRRLAIEKAGSKTGYVCRGFKNLPVGDGLKEAQAFSAILPNRSGGEGLVQQVPALLLDSHGWEHGKSFPIT